MKHILLALAATVCLAAAPADATAVKEVSAAMESLKQAMIHKDGAALEKLLSDELMYTHSTGQLETKAQFVKSIASGKSIVERLDYPLQARGSDLREYGTGEGRRGLVP